MSNKDFCFVSLEEIEESCMKWLKNQKKRGRAKCLNILASWNIWKYKWMSIVMLHAYKQTIPKYTPSYIYNKYNISHRQQAVIYPISASQLSPFITYRQKQSKCLFSTSSPPCPFWLNQCTSHHFTFSTYSTSWSSGRVIIGSLCLSFISFGEICAPRLICSRIPPLLYHFIRTVLYF